jgi:hypothetical protein
VNNDGSVSARSERSEPRSVNNEESDARDGSPLRGPLGPSLGAILITLAALVKAPAALGLVFLVPIWGLRMVGPARWARASAYTVGLVAVTVVVVTAIAGTGYGWVAALNTPATVHTWTSVLTDLGLGTGLLLSMAGVASMDQVVLWWRMAGLAAAGVICLILLRRHDRIAPVLGLGIGLSAVVLLGPVMHPWYVLWGVVPLAAAARDARLRRIVVVGSVAFAVLVLPGGVTPAFNTGVGAALGFGAVFLVDRLCNSPDWRLGLLSALESLRQVLQRQPVPVHAETGYHPGGYRRDNRMVPELFTRVNVGNVHLDQGSAQQGTRVAQRVGVMRPRSGVEYHRGGVIGGLVQPGDELGFNVGLADLDLEAEFLADRDASVDEVGVRGQPVDVGLPGSEPTEVHPVENDDPHDEDTSR